MKQTHRFMTLFLLSVSFILCADTTDIGALGIPCFPGAEGWGTQTKGGRGGKVFVVKNLNDGGAESLREAVEASGPRIVVFEVGGIISQKKALIIEEPFITIAGQTAPWPGITLANNPLWIGSHDVCIQHIAVRVTSQHSIPVPNCDRSKYVIDCNNPDNISILPTKPVAPYNVVIDHVSGEWSVDENMSSGYVAGALDGKGFMTPHDFTFSNCLIAEALKNGGHDEGGHSKNQLIGGDNTNYSLLRNLYAHADDRSPLCQDEADYLLINCVMYNSANTFISASKTRRAVIGNVRKPGLDHPDEGECGTFLVMGQGGIGYANDNIDLCYNPSFSSDPWAFTNADPNIRRDAPPVWVLPLTVLPASETMDYVLKNVGSHPADRDPIDKRVIQSVIDGTGRVPKTEADVGGVPEEMKTMKTRALSLPADPNGDSDGDGYTNIEEFCHEWAAKVEGRSSVVVSRNNAPDARTISFKLMAGKGTYKVFDLQGRFKANISTSQFAVAGMNVKGNMLFVSRAAKTSQILPGAYVVE